MHIWNIHGSQELASPVQGTGHQILDATALSTRSPRFYEANYPLEARLFTIGLGYLIASVDSSLRLVSVSDVHVRVDSKLFPTRQSSMYVSRTTGVVGTKDNRFIKVLRHFGAERLNSISNDSFVRCYTVPV